jgi:aminoglycoside phosphotransferase (APT) family kinase protein
MERPQLEAIGRWLSALLGAPCEVLEARPLAGGAIQENWLLQVTLHGAIREYVLRRDAPASIAASHSRREEFAILEVAHQAGVMTPRPIGFCEDAGVIGAPFALMAKLEGVGFGPRIVRDMSLGGDRERLVQDIGAELARIHAIRPPQAALDFLGVPPADPVAADIAALRAGLDAMGVARPALEWSLRHCERHLTPSGQISLIHRDLRTGNYMVDEKSLTGVLDWEFAGWGDPLSDLGWFCAGCWRFGRDDLEAGGVGSRGSLYAGYRSAGAGLVDDARVRLWEIMAHIRWAMIALQQGHRHISAQEPSLALALTSRIVPELELAILRATAPRPDGRKQLGEPAAHVTHAGEAMGAALLAIAGKELSDRLLPKLTGEDRTTARMIASAMRMASRELAMGEGLPERAGATSLAATIRAGQADDCAARHAAVLRAAVRAVALTKPDILSDDERALV